MSAGIIYSNGAALTATAAGTAGQVLTSQGSGSPPIFATGGGGGGSTVYFQAALTNSAYTNATGDGTTVQPVIFDTTVINTGSGYDNTTGIFTAPTTDFYFFNCNILLSGVDIALNDALDMSISFTSYISRVEVSAANMSVQSTSGRLIFPMCGGVYLTTGDQVLVTVIVTGTSKGVSIVGQSDNSCYFSGFSLH